MRWTWWLTFTDLWFPNKTCMILFSATGSKPALFANSLVIYEPWDPVSNKTLAVMFPVGLSKYTNSVCSKTASSLAQLANTTDDDGADVFCSFDDVFVASLRGDFWLLFDDPDCSVQIMV